MMMKLFLGFAVALPLVICVDVISSRIVGGQHAAKNQFPFQVALIYKRQITCGGSLIDKMHVLTAAHCIQHLDGLSVLAGTNRLSTGGEKRNVSIGVAHEDYLNFNNDIGIIRMEKPLRFSDSIKPIELFTKEVPLNASVIISGWGMTSNSSLPSDRLKYNALKLMSKEDCSQFTELAKQDGTICLAHNKGNGACFGDSGGSAVYSNKLIGVANFIVSSCGSPNPDGYAKVSYFADWIKKTVKYLNSDDCCDENSMNEPKKKKTCET